MSNRHSGSNRGKGILIVAVVSLVLGFVLVGYGKRSADCTLAVDARVVEMEKSTGSDKNTYRPVYGFEYGGQSYEVHGHAYTNSEKYAVGQSVMLKINPDQPEEFVDPARDRKTVIFVSLICGALLAAGIFVIVRG